MKKKKSPLAFITISIKDNKHCSTMIYECLEGNMVNELTRSYACMPIIEGWLDVHA